MFWKGNQATFLSSQAAWLTLESFCSLVFLSEQLKMPFLVQGYQELGPSTVWQVSIHLRSQVERTGTFN